VPFIILTKQDCKKSTFFELYLSCGYTMSLKDFYSSSKRAECYLRLHKADKTITDANRAVAMNSSSTISRWRRQEATQAIEPYFQFLDLR